MVEDVLAKIVKLRNTSIKPGFKPKGDRAREIEGKFVEY